MLRRVPPTWHIPIGAHHVTATDAPAPPLGPSRGPPHASHTTDPASSSTPKQQRRKKKEAEIETTPQSLSTLLPHPRRPPRFRRRSVYPSPAQGEASGRVTGGRAAGS
ncbi:hypothetical protein ZWY2020_019422 [Hordeum vulgare]|nr:hypothetical protein ZWY2020_019422 [Hordeum vulgare]